VSLLLAALRGLAEAVFIPLGLLPPWASLLVLSSVLSLVLLFAFRLLTPQARLARLKERLGATVYELRLFAASPSRVLAAQGRAILLVILYLLLALPPLVVLGPVVGALFARAALEYELRPISTGETALLRVSLDRAVARSAIRVEAAGPGLEVRPPLLLLSSGKEVAVRVRPTRPGVLGVLVEVEGRAVEKRLVACDGRDGSGCTAAVSPMRARAGAAGILLGREPPLPPWGGPVATIEIDHPARTLALLGLPWWLVLLLLPLVAALALRRWLGVVL
jgi:hypothetical protein